MPDPTIQNVVFQVGAADTDHLRAAWLKALERYAPELAAQHINLPPSLATSLEVWAEAYTAFNDSVSALSNLKAPWTTISPLARAKIKTRARALQTDAAAVARDAAAGLTALQSLGDPAEKELTTALTALARRAAEHQQRAAVTARGR